MVLKVSCWFSTKTVLTWFADAWLNHLLCLIATEKKTKLISSGKNLLVLFVFDWCDIKLVMAKRTRFSGREVGWRIYAESSKTQTKLRVEKNDKIDIKQSIETLGKEITKIKSRKESFFAINLDREVKITFLTKETTLSW